MCGGGGGYSPPPDRSVELEQIRQAERQREREAEQARIEAEKQAARDKFATSLSSSRNAALTGARTAAQLRGLDPTSFEDYFVSEVERIAGGIPDLDPNPGNYFGPDFGNRVLDTKQTGLRTQYGNQVRELFAPNFDTQAFADTADDPIIQAILGDQYNEALGAVNRARARGTINDSGFATAQAKLDSQRKVGESLAQSLGGNVLQRYRGDLRSVRDAALDAANNYQLGSTWDTAPFATQRDTKLSTLQGALEGDIRGTVGGQKFFDIGTVLNDAGMAQGATNPQGGSSLTEIMASRERTRDAKRGLGGGSTF